LNKLRTKPAQSAGEAIAAAFLSRPIARSTFALVDAHRRPAVSAKNFPPGASCTT
jgi:hypothetical protein